MQYVRSSMTGLASLALIASFASPTLGAKTVIFDEELDAVTAAGQPKIAMAQAGSDAFATNDQIYHVEGSIETDSQNRLRALTLNNVFGENQVANGLNVQAGSGTTNASTQANEILQSWGAAKAWDAATVDGVAAPGGAGGAGAPGGNVNGRLVKDSGNGGNGGNGGNAAAAPGVIRLLWAFADEIADADSEFGPASALNQIDTAISGTVQAMSQQDLAALTVNNVFGLNQVGNGTNIAAGGLTGADITGGADVFGTQQSNVISQYRGTPANAAAVITAAK